MLPPVPGESPATATHRRLEQELSNFLQDPPEGCWAQPEENENIFNWTATIQGPRDSPYEDGLFELRIGYHAVYYPRIPPSVQFITKIYHPNIGRETGFTGLNILHEEWSPVLTISTLLVSLRGLLSTPDPKDAVEPEIAVEYEMRREEYEETAREWTRRFASGSASQG